MKTRKEEDVDIEEVSSRRSFNENRYSLVSSPAHLSIHNIVLKIQVLTHPYSDDSLWNVSCCPGDRFHKPSLKIPLYLFK